MGVYYILLFLGDENEGLLMSGSPGCSHFRSIKAGMNVKAVLFQFLIPFLWGFE